MPFSLVVGGKDHLTYSSSHYSILNYLDIRVLENNWWNKDYEQV